MLLRPHLKCNNTWRIGPFAADCWSVPWSERKIEGTLTFPNGNVVALREGDLPNRNPFVPDDWPEPRSETSKETHKSISRLTRKTNIDLRDYDIAERDWLFKDNPNCSAAGAAPR